MTQMKDAILYLSTAVTAAVLCSPAFSQGSTGGMNQGPFVMASPEIDGPAGVAAIALVVCAGIVAYNRYRK